MLSSDSMGTYKKTRALYSNTNYSTMQILSMIRYYQTSTTTAATTTKPLVPSKFRVELNKHNSI
uniref:Uncharacterized protein n=1 Tax=Arundo donax TaxID=35708 RepID=A0A0A9HLJ5_ARUDO